MSQVEYDVDEGEEENKDDTQYVAVEDPPQDEDQIQDDDDNEDEEEETRLGGGREDDDEDDKRERRRQENKNRRQRQREARDRNERELNFLRQRNEDLERRFSQLEASVDQRVTGSEIQTLDGQISKAKSDLTLANQVIAQAAEANDGKNLVEAMEHRDAIRDHLRELEGNQEYLKSDERRQPQQQPQEIDPRHAAHAQQFMADHDWWDPRGADAESQTVLAIDRSLVQEGYDPRQKDYWDELRERVQEQFPDRFNTRSGHDDDDDDDDDGDKGQRQQTERRSKGPEFRTGGRERPLAKNEVYISPERREAMEEAGVWDDPVLRNKYLKAYAQYDKENGGA